MTRRWFLLLLALLSAPAPKALSQSAPVSSEFSFAQALLTNSVITNFQAGAQITLAAGQTFEVSSNLTVDGASNSVVFSGAHVARIFHVQRGATLTLRNLQLYNGKATFGGAIYNEGSLSLSNCDLGGHLATNLSGIDGSTNSSSGNGNPGTSGSSAIGGAIYSAGPGSLVIQNCTFTNNLVKAGNGGNGGNAIPQFVFGNNGGNAGDGASANAGAIYSDSASNFIYASIFEGNSCVCGAGGLGGATGGARFAGHGGTGGVGGSGVGGAIFCQRKITIGACFFQDNGVTGGATAPASPSTGNYARGQAGGSAAGGAIYLGAAAGGSRVTNSTILGNFCIGGLGGSTVANVEAGSGGSALGGGLVTVAPTAQVLYCTVATNILTPGAAGTASGGGANGSTGLTQGSQIYASPGSIKLNGSILAGGAPGSDINALGAGDAGLNLSSDTSAISRGDSLANRNPFLAVTVASVTAFTNISTNGVYVTNLTYPTTNFDLPVVTNFIAVSNTLIYPTNLPVFNLSTNLVFGGGVPYFSYDEIISYSYTNSTEGSVTNVSYRTNFFASQNGGPTTLALNTAKSPAFQYITGIPGISFPLTDQRLYYRVSPTTIGAFDPDAAPALSVTTLGSSALTNINVPAATNSISSFPASYNVTNYTFATNGVTNFISFYDAAIGAFTNIVYTTNIIITQIRPYTPPITTNYFATVIPVPVIVGPTVIGLGQTATLTATVPYNVPGLGFQWQRNGVNLTNNANYAGATTSNLVFKKITQALAGSYSVIAGTTLAYTQTSAPWDISVTDLSRVTLTAPAANARTAAEFVTVRGRFTLPDDVTNINVYLTNLNTGDFINAGPVDINYGRSAGTFSAVIQPEPGTNILAAWADDSRGPNFSSLVATRKFFSVARTPLSVAINPADVRAGTLSLRDGANLNVGQSYAIVARPAAKWIFANWTASTNGGPSSILSESATLRFEMETNLALTANFISNEFAASIGNYNGLFYSPETNAGAPLGIVSGLSLAHNGSYSAKVFALGFISNSAITGVFTPATGLATNTITNGSVTLSLAMSFTNGAIAGSVSNAIASSPLLLERTVKSNLTAAYTALFIPSNAATNSPQGSAAVVLTNRQGTVNLVGALADGTSISQSVGVSSDGAIPLFASLYSGGGAIAGWLAPEGQTQSNLLWIKPAASSGLYPGGFTNVLGSLGARWIAPKSGNLAVPDLADGGLLTFSNGYLAAPITFDVSLSANNRLTTADSTNGQLLGVVNPKNGLFTVTLTNNLTLTAAHGVLLQTTSSNGIVGGGWFLTSSNAGSMILTIPANP